MQLWIANKIGKRQMENLPCPELGTTVVKPFLNTTCIAGEFTQKRMESLTRLALKCFREGNCKADLFPGLDWQRMRDHDENDDGKPSKIGQKGDGCVRVDDNVTYNSEVFYKDGMVEGDGGLIPEKR
jgi:hypothetical protein